MNSIKYGILAIAILLAQYTSAQTVKTDVAVFGATESGLAAAIQAAHSNVKTTFIVEGNELISNISEQDTTFSTGIAASFMRMVLKARTDSASGVVSPFSAKVASEVLKDWTDTIKNLTVIRNSGWVKADGGAKGWDIKLKDGKIIKSHIAVDATSNATLASKAGIGFDPATGYYRTLTPLAQTDLKLTYSNLIYRTSAAIANTSKSGPVMIPLGSIVADGDAENFILAGKLPILKAPKQLENANMALGQAAGAAAAYCAFFKTTTKNLNVRITQGELMAFKSSFIPYGDIARTDSNYIALQHIGATGLLKANVNSGKLLFQPDSMVSAAELRAPMKELYSRSQIWFADNKASKLTLDDALKMIKFSASRGEELNREVEKAWTKTFKFAGKYDLTHLITRREFAVLADTYLKPFNVRIDMRGNLGS